MSAVVVFDTNILVSAFRSPGGSPARCIALARAGQIRSLTCREILDELHDKLMVKFAVPLPDADAAVKDIESFSTIIGISNTLKVIAADPDDDKIIECAVVG